MAVAVTLIDPRPVADFVGQIVPVRARVQFDATYPAGGEAITAAMFGLSTILSLQITVSTQIGATTGNYCSWDRANSKLQLFESGASGDALIETNLADSSAVILDVVVYGRV